MHAFEGVRIVVDRRMEVIAFGSAGPLLLQILDDRQKIIIIWNLKYKISLEDILC